MHIYNLRASTSALKIKQPHQLYTNKPRATIHIIKTSYANSKLERLSRNAESAPKQTLLNIINPAKRLLQI